MTDKTRYEILAKETTYENGKEKGYNMVSFGYTWAYTPQKAVSQMCYRLKRKKSMTRSLGQGSYYTNTLIAVEAK